MADAPSWISAIAAALGVFIAGTAAYVGLRTYADQRTSYDVTLALSIFAQLNRYWDRISAGAGTTQYNYGQILTHFEIAAALFNDGVLTNQASKILCDHIVEVFTTMEASDSGQAIIAHCNSSPETFKELRAFAKKNFPKALLAQAFSESEEQPTGGVPNAPDCKD